jgi:membrane associated rhomboid family serine protease
MGASTRDYWRSDNTGRWADWGFYQLTPVVKYLILANIAVFLLQILVVREVRVSPLEILRQQDPELDRLLNEKGDDPEALEKVKKRFPWLEQALEQEELGSSFFPTQRVSIVQEWFELDTKKVVHSGQVWRLVTHAFCHERLGIFHILFNMLFLYWFGCTMEAMYGWREFLLFYLTAAVVAGLAFVALDLYTGSAIPGIGASGAVMAVTMLYAMHFPRETICIFWVFNVEMRWLIIFYVIWDLHPVLLALAGDRFFTGIAHSAHLGGLAFGFLYARYHWRLEGILERIPRLGWLGRQRARLRLLTFPRESVTPDPDARRLDEILQKICESGRSTLTDEERDFLQKASERLRNRLE